MRVVTSGASYVDIDVYGGCVAYAELLQAQGEQAIAVSTGPLNESVSRTVRSWLAPLRTDYSPSDSDTFTIIDVSNPQHFDKIVDIARVDEVIDHHVGFESYWREHIGDKAHIEFIGAACTLVYERWKDAGLIDNMSPLSARLLICGILDNTLNFGAEVTDQRDHDAYNALLSKADLPDDWTAQYFRECEKGILEDVTAATRNDAKTIGFKTFNGPVRVGQLAMWDSKRILTDQTSQIQSALSSNHPSWFMNLISIGEHKSYFISDNQDVQLWISQLLHAKFTGSVGVADRLWLRKEIIKQDIDASAQTES